MRSLARGYLTRMAIPGAGDARLASSRVRALQRTRQVERAEHGRRIVGVELAAIPIPAGLLRQTIGHANSRTPIAIRAAVPGIDFE